MSKGPESRSYKAQAVARLRLGAKGAKGSIKGGTGGSISRVIGGPTDKTVVQVQVGGGAADDRDPNGIGGDEELM